MYEKEKIFDETHRVDNEHLVLYKVSLSIRENK